MERQNERGVRREDQSTHVCESVKAEAPETLRPKCQLDLLHPNQLPNRRPEFKSA